MNARKSIFIISGMVLLGAVTSLNYRHAQQETIAPSRVADGTAPLPPLPKPDSMSTGVLVADGTAPLPPLPKPTASSTVA